MNSKAVVILAFLFVLAATHTSATRNAPDHASGSTQKRPHEKPRSGGGGGGGFPGFFGTGSGFGIPGFGSGYGSGFGGPGGGYAKGGVVRPTVVCKEKGPCHGKKLTCPAKCFKTYSRAGKGFGGGGGGGGCTIDCAKKCVASC